MPDPAALARLAALFADDPRVQPRRLFGSAGLMVNGKVFLTVHAAHVAFKLPPQSHARALALPGAARWNPSGVRELREWVSVPAAHADEFPDLARAARRYVAAPAPTPAGGDAHARS